MNATSDLLLPSEGARVVRELYSRAIRRGMSTALSLGEATPVLKLFPREIAPILRAEPGLLASSMRMPSRLSLTRCLTPSSPRIAEELALSLALDVARAGLLTRPWEANAAVPRLVDERAELAFFLPPDARLTFERDGLRVAATEGAAHVAWSMPLTEADATLRPIGGHAVRSHVPLFADATLVLEDNNPLAELEAHPNKSGNRVDLGDRPIEEWTSQLRAGFAIVEEHLPEIADEMRLILRHVGPVGHFAEQHLSASYVEATGVVYLSLHPNELTLAEALVHEFQHNKLNLLLSEDAVLENADRPLFASPVRPDPRPLRGVLLAVHAFQPIAVMYERMIAKGSPRAESLRARLGEVARTCREGCEVLLPNARPTPRGKPLFDDIAALDRKLAVHLGELPHGA